MGKNTNKENENNIQIYLTECLEVHNVASSKPCQKTQWEKTDQGKRVQRTFDAPPELYLW